MPPGVPRRRYREVVRTGQITTTVAMAPAIIPHAGYAWSLDTFREYATRLDAVPAAALT